MRYRKLDADGDMVFGAGTGSFFVNSPEAVQQAVRTRLGLFLGEWFLDTSEGMDWTNQVLGKYTEVARDIIIRDRIVNTRGVRELVEYGSGLERETRRLRVIAVIDTIYGPAPIEERL